MSAADGPVPRTGWQGLLTGRRGARIALLCSGAGLHAINLYLATTILPTVVRDIGGLALYAWNTSVFVLGSMVGSAMAAWMATRMGGRRAYEFGVAGFTAGCTLCALAPAMGWLVAGRLVQGLGGGLLVALPYVLMPRLFEAAWWPRVTALVSGMWGVATLLGPAVGGGLAESGWWRQAFAALIPVSGLLALAAWRLLPDDEPATDRAEAAPAGQLARLCLAVMSASVAGSVQHHGAQAGWAAVSVASFAWVWRHERSPGAKARLLPRGALQDSLPRRLYGAMALLAVTVTCSEGFVPLFLQTLHGVGPLVAGLMAASLSAGWTAGAIVASSASGAQVAALLRWAPRLSVVGMVALAALLPAGLGIPATGPLVGLTLAMVMSGVAVGMAWPHLATATLAQAPADEAALAGASVMTVQLIATAVAASLAGLVVNTAGLPEGRASTAAAWLFGLSALGPLLLACRWQSAPATVR